MSLSDRPQLEPHVHFPQNHPGMPSCSGTSSCQICWDFSMTLLIQREEAGGETAPFELCRAGIWVSSFPDSQVLGGDLCHSTWGEQPQHPDLSTRHVSGRLCPGVAPVLARQCLPCLHAGRGVLSPPMHPSLHKETHMHTHVLLLLGKPIAWLLSQIVFNYTVELITTGSS